MFNALQLVIFSSPKFSKIIFGFVSCIMAIVSTVGLVWNFLFYKYLPLVSFNLGLMSSFGCFTFVWFSRVMQQIPLYTQVLITLITYLNVKSIFEKLEIHILFNLYKKCLFFQVRYPRKFKIFESKLKVFYIFLLMCVLDIAINMTNGFSYLSRSTFKNSTIVSCRRSNTMDIVANFSTAMLRSIIPGIIIIALDILIIQILYASKVIK